MKEDIEAAKLYFNGDIIAEGIIEDGSLFFTTFDLTVDASIELFLAISISSSAVTGHAFSISLYNVETKAGVTYSEDKVNAYISSAPTDPVIDGLFDEWKSPINDQIGEVENPNIDISSIDRKKFEDYNYFYLKVEGNILYGNALISHRALNIPTEINENDDYYPTEKPSMVGSQEDNPLPVNTGEDAVYIFILSGSGYEVKSGYLAEKCIRITGKDGIILSSSLMDFAGIHSNDFQWIEINDIDAASSGKELEVVCEEKCSNGVYFHMVAWDGEKDYSIESDPDIIEVELIQSQTEVNVNGNRGEDTIIVDISGNGDYTSIQDGIDNASSGDTIKVWAGTYYENVVVNKSIAIEGNGSAYTFVNGSMNGVIIEITFDYVNLSGFNLSSGKNFGIYLNSVNNCSIDNNTIFYVKGEDGTNGSPGDTGEIGAGIYPVIPIFRAKNAA